MPFIERVGLRATWFVTGTAAVLLATAGCTVSRPTVPASGATAATPPQPSPQPADPPTAAAATRAAPERSPPTLQAARRARSWQDFQMIAAQRLVAANQSMSYVGAVPEPLLAIPVLEIELNADGSVRRIVVVRHPRQARDTVDLAISAVHRAAPFGDVSHLPRPWKFTEVFLFDDDRRFKPRTLDL